MPRQYNAMSQNRYVSRKRTAKSSIPRSMKSAKASKTLKKVVSDVISSKAETKHIARYSTLYDVASQMLNTNCVHIIPPCVQGIAGGQRIGDRISLKKFELVIRYSLKPRNFVDGGTQSFRPFPCGVFFDTYVFAVRGKTSFTGAGAPSTTDIERFLEVSGAYNRYEGDHFDYDSRVNDDIINLIYKRRDLINTCNNIDNESGFANNTVLPGGNTSIGAITIPGLANRVPKNWVYDTLTDTYPRNCNIFVVVVCTDAAGTAPVGGELTQSEGKFWVTSHVDYIDM